MVLPVYAMLYHGTYNFKNASGSTGVRLSEQQSITRVLVKPPAASGECASDCVPSVRQSPPDFSDKLQNKFSAQKSLLVNGDGQTGRN